MAQAIVINWKSKNFTRAPAVRCTSTAVIDVNADGGDNNNNNNFDEFRFNYYRSIYFDSAFPSVKVYLSSIDKAPS